MTNSREWVRRAVACARGARAAAGFVLGALFPERCLACGAFGSALHDACASGMPRADPPRCEACWRPSSTQRCADCAGLSIAPAGFDALRAAFRFEGEAHQAIVEAKFHGVSNLLPPLGRAAADAVPAGWLPAVVVPVPLSRSRERERGFNQAELLAAAVAERLAVPLDASLVRRRLHTAPQSSLSAARRRRNLEGAFEMTAARAPPRVLLVDDVTTTGTTLGTLARVLRDGGSRSVFALAVARED